MLEVVPMPSLEEEQSIEMLVEQTREYQEGLLAWKR